MSENLSDDEKQILLRLAREALEDGVRGKDISPLNLTLLTPLLRAEGASFVTLTINGQLRGCIGSLQPYQSLVEDVREHAVAAALQDYRFPPVRPSELSKIHLEISRLTLPQPLDYTDAADLLSKLRPGIDGVILRDGPRRATFLPQVWEQIPDKAEFLNHLCTKMGAAPNLWRQKALDVQIYQVEEFHE
ncbi:MAG: AmmeMemoRadiSam system protein A [Chloroflexi bacterium]|nr:AmmeMemoRadiSam system protein A [Chloroflexota bacterium]